MRLRRRSGLLGFRTARLYPAADTGFGNGYTPGQTILTARGQRITNSTDGEMDVLLSPRTSLTFVGGYSLLDRMDDSQLNYGNVIFRPVTTTRCRAQNTIGLSYQFSSFNYSNFDQSIKNNIISVSYGRRITGKLAFQVVWRTRHRFHSNADHDRLRNSAAERVPVNGLHDAGICVVQCRAAISIAASRNVGRL